MITHATVSFLVLALGWAEVQGYFVNDFDEYARLECPNNQVFSYIGSVHSNQDEDRRWAFECRPAPGTTAGCTWTNYVNEYDQPLLHNCPRNEVMNGMSSIHNNGPEDRKFKLQCCRINFKTTRNCYYTQFINDLDRDMHYYVPQGMVIKGAYSIHDNDAEDRRWKFYLCDLV